MCVVMSLQACRGQTSGPQENTAMVYNAGVSRAEEELAEEEGAEGGADRIVFVAQEDDTG